MPVSIVRTAQEQLVSARVIEALREGIETCGSAVLLVPSFAQALDAQRALAAERGLALSVATTTPTAWLKERWEVWGDGRAIADSVTLTVLGRQAMLQATPDELGPIKVSDGVVAVLASLVGRSLPWLPVNAAGVDRDACLRAGLTAAENCLVGLAGRMAGLLAEHGFVSAAEVSVLVPHLLANAGARVPQVVVAGFSSMGRADRELVRALAGLTEVTVVANVCDGPASMQVERLLAWFGQEGATQSCPVGAEVARAPQLSRLLDALFSDDLLVSPADGAIELLMPAGPVAEAQVVAQRVARLVAEDEAQSVVVAVPDVARARRELLPKLAARGLPVRMGWSTALLDCPSAQAFFAFAHTVAQLSDLAATWPEPVEGLEGPVAQLGDMSWLPPRHLTDFLLSDIAHVDAAQAWWTDAVWRGNRLLTPARVLAMLQSERDTSPAVARATAELLRGRMGTAASKLLLPYVESLGQPDARLDEHADEARAVLQAILQLAGSLRELGVTTDRSQEGAVSLAQLVEIAEWAAEGVSVMTRMETQAAAGLPLVTVMGVGGAARLAPGSVDALVVMGLTTAEQGIKAGDDLLQALLEMLDVEPVADPMAEARANFRALVAVPRRHLVLERATHDADAKETYPSVMLSELLAACGISASASFEQISLPKESRPETSLGANLSPLGVGPLSAVASDPAPAGLLTDASRGQVFVPQEGSEVLPGGKPVLSASQIETYLECPYKWFSLRRLRLGTVDAGHGGMEMGTFAHRVLEVTHRELLARALEAQWPGIPRDELLARIEVDPAVHVAGSRIDEATLEAARAALDLEFDLHQQHMYMVKRPRQAQQLLVAHDSSDRAQEDQLRQDLLSSLAYQTGILQGFEPRLFEWSFGRGGQLVPYADAYITGTVDRIDVSPHGTAVIIDYKHNSPNGFAAEYDALQEGVLEGDSLPNRVQSLVYAQVVRRAFEGRLRLVGSVYLSTKSPHALAGVADANVADMVFGSVSSKRYERVAVPRGADGGSGMDALLDRTEELVAEQVRQMMAGNVEARPRDAHSCDFCPVMQCERRVAR